MAGIEDFVVESIMQDMQQQQQMQPGPGNQLQGPPSSVPMAPPGSNQAYAEQLAQQNRHMNVNPETGQRWGAYADQYEAQRVAALQRADAARSTLMQAMRGLDPQIQGTILQRLGINPGVVKSELQQKKELLDYQNQLAAPQRETENTLKAMGIQRQQAQGQQELALKERELREKTAGQGEARNVQLMRVLAMMMQGNPQLQQTIAPLLLQLMQASGINLAPPSAPASNRGATSPRPGVRITREE